MQLRVAGETRFYAGSTTGGTRGDLTLGDLSINPANTPRVTFLVGSNNTALVQGTVAPTTSGGVLVETFVVEMDGGTWHVVSWQRPITRAGRVAHERITLMASSIEGAFAREFSAVEGSDGIRHRLVAGLNAIRPNEDPNPALSRSLLALADEVESRGTPARGPA